jgi:hypothetical protein
VAVNALASATLRALCEQGVPVLPVYSRALRCACKASPPAFVRKQYASLYRESAADPEWVAVSLATAAQSEGEGSTHLWDMAACTTDGDIARQMQQHAIDESRHSRGYVTLLELLFPEVVSEALLKKLQKLSPGYKKSTPVVATPGSPYAYCATVDELIQMNIAETRTRVYHLLQRPVLLAFCKAERRERVRRILDSLLFDETRHIAYTACLIERAAQSGGVRQVMDLMHERLRDFNEITEEELGRGTLVAA